MRFQGKVVLITGASSGIGATTAIHFSKQGALLAITGRNEENLKKTASQCEQNAEFNSPFLILGDVSVEKDIENIIKQTIDHFKRLDVLVNNAGVAANGTIETTKLEQYDQMMNTNMRSAYYLTQLAVPYLLKTKGNIVNVSSLSGVRAFHNFLPYCISKAAMDQFTRCLSLDLAGRGVRVNSVNPGIIETDIHKKTGLDEAAYQRFLTNTQEYTPLKRPGKPEEVASTIAFLASDDSSFITGMCIVIDGGRHTTSPRSIWPQK